MYRLSNISFSLEGTNEELLHFISKKIRVPKEAIFDFTIVKKSIDARDKGNIHFVYALQFKLHPPYGRKLPKEVEKIAPAKAQGGTLYQKAAKPPVVVGLGPAGLFAAYSLCLNGNPPLVLERGRQVEKRAKDVDRFFLKGILDPQSNIQFGEGGAGTFSDGKLTTGIKSPFTRQVLETFVACGAPEEILYLQKPHIGTDILRRVVKNMREELLRLGADIRFESKLTDVLIDQGWLKGVVWEDGNGHVQQKETEHLFLAIGHSARDTYRMLHNRGLYMEQKPFAIGARIEHPQGLINLGQYGTKFANHPRLGAAEYKLHQPTKDGRGVYTFCMCPGGQVVAAASTLKTVVTNGMSHHARDGQNANAALLVGIRPEDFKSAHPLAGLDFQEEIEKQAYLVGGENYRAPAQRIEDFLVGRKTKAMGQVIPSYLPGVTPADLSECLPGYVVQNMRQGILKMDQQLRGFALADGVLTGVETRSSAPVRIKRDDKGQGNIQGIFPLGEGAGYAGGIMSAAVDGMKAIKITFENKEDEGENYIF